MPGGFGYRGVEGKIRAARFCRENGVPYLGLCLGMQVLCIEFARHVFDSPEANSTEFDLFTRYPVIGGSMRLLCGAEGDLDDPIGGSPEVYAACARTILRHLDRFIMELVRR